MFHPQQRSRLLYALVMSVALSLFAARLRHAHKDQARPLGRLTAEQVIRRSRSICAAVVPQLDRLTLSATPLNSSIPLWEVQCKDESGRDRVYLTWYADTGRLCEEGSWPQSQGSALPAMSASEAVEATRGWLRVLGMIDPSDPWHLAAPSIDEGDRAWTVEWKSQKLHAIIQIEARAGDLIRAAFAPARAHPLTPVELDPAYNPRARAVRSR